MSRQADEEDWIELNRAIAKLWVDEYSYSKKVKVSFSRFGGGDRSGDEIGIFTTGIDNAYDHGEDWRWEIFLNKDGTWRID